MDDLIILLVAWLIKKFAGGENKSATPPRQVPRPVPPGVGVRQPAPPGLALRRPGPPPLPGVRIVQQGPRRIIRRVAAQAPAAPAQAAESMPAVSPRVAPKVAKPRLATATVARPPLAAMLTRSALRQQIVLNEILQPPLALREP